MMTKNSKRSISIIFALAMMLSLFLASTASAENYSDSFSLAAGTSDTFTVNGSTITNISSSAPGVLRVESSSGSTASLYGVSAGTAVLTVNSTKTSTGATDVGTITVTVTASGSSTQGTTLSAITVEAGKTATATTPSVATSYSSTNTSIATVAYSNQVLTITGVQAGSTQILYSISNASGVTENYIIPVTVTAAGTTNNNTSSSNGFNLQVGKVAETAAFYSVSAATSSAPEIAAVTIVDNKMRITGKSVGSATISYTAISTQGAAATSGTYNISVTTAADGSTTSNVTSSGTTSDGTGLKFSTNSRTLAVGKSYRLSKITLDGKSIAANQLYWLSSNDAVVKVNKTSGVLSIKKAGSATVIAVTKDGKSSQALSIKAE